MKFQFYDEVEDIVTGFKGKVTAITEEIIGLRRYGVTPPVKPDGALGDAYAFDEPQLSLLKEGDAELRRAGKLSGFKFSLGDKVRCETTGIAGVIIARTEFCSGCVRYAIQPPVPSSRFTFKSKTRAPDVHLQYEQLPKVVTAKAVAADVERKRGGPPSKVSYP